MCGLCNSRPLTQRAGLIGPGKLRYELVNPRHRAAARAVRASANLGVLGVWQVDFAAAADGVPCVNLLLGAGRAPHLGVFDGGLAEVGQPLKYSRTAGGRFLTAAAHCPYIVVRISSKAGHPSATNAPNTSIAILVRCVNICPLTISAVHSAVTVAEVPVWSTDPAPHGQADVTFVITRDDKQSTGEVTLRL